MIIKRENLWDALTRAENHYKHLSEGYEFINEKRYLSHKEKALTFEKIMIEMIGEENITIED